MFTPFNRELLINEMKRIKSKQFSPTPKITTHPTTFISEGELPERFTLVFKKFDNHFMFRQSKHIIDLNKGQPLLDKFISEDISNFSGVLVNLFEQLEDKRYEKYRTKNNNLLIPCLTDVEYYCPLCNLIQTMRTISSYNLENLNTRSHYYEIIENIHKIAHIISQTFYRIENIVLVGIVYDEQVKSGDVKVLVSNKLFNSVVSYIANKMKEDGLLLSELEFVKVKVIGKPIDKYTYQVESVDGVEFNDDVVEWCRSEDLYDVFGSYVNEWTKDRVKSILHKKTLQQISTIEQDFTSLIDSTTQLLLDMVKDELNTIS